MTVLEKSRTAGWTSKVRKAFIAMLAMILSLVSPAQTAVFADFTLPYRSIGVTFYLQADLALTGGFSDAHQSPVIYTPDGVTPAYCVQADVLWLYENSFYESSTYDAMGMYSSKDKERLKALTYFGYGYPGRTDDMWYYGTQFAIWKTFQPEVISKGYLIGPVGNNQGQYNATVDSMAAQIIADVDRYYDSIINAETSIWKVLDASGKLIKAADDNTNPIRLHLGETYTFIDEAGLADSSTLSRNDFGSRFTRTGTNTYSLTLDSSDFNTVKAFRFEPPLKQYDVIGSNTAYMSTNNHQTFVSRSTPSAARIKALNDSSEKPTVEIETEAPKVQITKDDGNGNTVSGAVLSLYQISDTHTDLIETWTSTDQPEQFEIPAGNYRIVEDSAPNGYYRSDPVDFTVRNEYDKVQTFSMSDEPIRVKIAKVDGSDHTPVTGARLQLTDGGMKVFEEWVTDGTDHTVDASVLEAGKTYTVKEIEAPEGYYLNDTTVTFQIPVTKPATGLDENQYLIVDFENSAIDYQVEKVDAVTGLPLSGAKLQLIGENNTVLEEWITDGTPHKLDRTLLKADRYYAIREAEAPAGYFLMAQDQSFYIDPNYVGQTYTLTAKNQPISYYINKVNTDGEPVAGAKLAVYDSSNVRIDEWTTDGNPHQLSGLKQGEVYSIEESSAPAGYYASSKRVEFTVNSASLEDQQNNFYVEVTDIPIEFYVEKIDEGTKQRLGGVEITLQSEAGKDIAVITTSDSSAVKIPGEYLEAGKTYRLHETKALDGYYYADDDVTFTVPSTVEEAKSQKSSYFTKPIKDKRIRYSVAKVNEETNSNVAGATLGLYADPHGNTLIHSWVTTEESYMLSDYVTLTAGTSYWVREIDAPNGFFVSESAVEIHVPYSVTTNETVKAVFKNIPIHWNIRKVDENGDLLTTTYNRSSCILEVYDTNETVDDISDDILITTLDTADKKYAADEYFDMQQYIDEGQIKGGHHYRIHEKLSPLGYKLSDDQIVEVLCTGTTSTLLTSFPNEAVTVHFKKVDENGTVIDHFNTLEEGTQGFVIGIYDEEKLNAGDPDALVVEIDTSDAEYRANGYADIGMYLSVQKTYVAKELKQPSGYYRAKDITFTVDSLPKNGSVYELVMVDPTIKVQFRKENHLGEKLISVNGEGFEFQIIDDATGAVVGTINTLSAGDPSTGWVQIGQWLEEGKTYRIHEAYAPGQYSYSTEDVVIRVPGYYVESSGSVKSVIV